jgi:hypothetical protein
VLEAAQELSRHSETLHVEVQEFLKQVEVPAGRGRS